MSFTKNETYNEELNNQLIKLGNRINNIFKLIREIYDNTDGLFYNGDGHFKQGPCGKFSETKDFDLIIIEFYYGSPSKLHTYLGELNLLGSNGSTPSANKIMWEKLNKIFDIKLIKKHKKIKDFGVIGPWYQIHKIKEDVLNVTHETELEECYKYQNNIDTFSYDMKKQYFQKYVLDNK